MGRTACRIGVLTATISVRKRGGSLDKVAAFFREVSRRANDANPEFRVSLCKQLHCDGQVLRRMHARYIEQIAALRREVDPTGLINSRFWRVLA